MTVGVISVLIDTDPMTKDQVHKKKIMRNLKLNARTRLRIFYM